MYSEIDCEFKDCLSLSGDGKNKLESKSSIFPKSNSAADTFSLLE